METSMNFKWMSFDTADAIFTEARTYLNAPTPPNMARWEQVLALDHHGSKLSRLHGERQKYFEEVRSYITGRLDHSWPDHLRVLESSKQPSDESYWALGRTLTVQYQWKEMTKKNLEEMARAWKHPRFELYTGLRLQALAERNLEIMLNALAEGHFVKPTFLHFSFGYKHFQSDSARREKYDALLELLLSRWGDSLEMLSINFPSTRSQDTLAKVLLERLSHDLAKMPALKWFEVLRFDMHHDDALLELLQILEKTTVTRLSLPCAVKESIDELIHITTESPKLFAKLDALLLDRLDYRQYTTLMESDALAHMSEKRFFTGYDVKTWEDQIIDPTTTDRVGF